MTATNSTTLYNVFYDLCPAHYIDTHFNKLDIDNFKNQIIKYFNNSNQYPRNLNALCEQAIKLLSHPTLSDKQAIEIQHNLVSDRALVLFTYAAINNRTDLFQVDSFKKLFEKISPKYKAITVAIATLFNANDFIFKAIEQNLIDVEAINTANCYAAASNNIMLLNDLTKQNISPNQSSEQETHLTIPFPLYWAIYHNQLEATWILLHVHKENANDKEAAQLTQSQSYLILAAQHGYLEILELLIDCNASVDFQDFAKNTALHHAAINNRIDCFKHLVASGAATGLKNREGKTAIELVKGSHTQKELESFIKKQAAALQSTNSPFLNSAGLIFAGPRHLGCKNIDDDHAASTAQQNIIKSSL